MIIPKKRQIALLAALAASVCGISATAFSGFASTGSINTDSIATDNAYLEPCNSCNPTEEDYENLTTFELLAIYPELSGDPMDNATSTLSDDVDASAGTEANTTATTTLPAPIGNTTTTSNQTNSGNSTGNSTSLP